MATHAVLNSKIPSCLRRGSNRRFEAAVESCDAEGALTTTPRTQPLCGCFVVWFCFLFFPKDSLSHMKQTKRTAEERRVKFFLHFTSASSKIWPAKALASQSEVKFQKCVVKYPFAQLVPVRARTSSFLPIKATSVNHGVRQVCFCFCFFNKKTPHTSLSLNFTNGSFS